ncbi:MAG: methylated-DNA--[protein]-cysteine S-methyltransferase [Sphingomonadaceae bacterium]
MLNWSALATPLGPLALVHDEEGVLWAAEFREVPSTIASSLSRFGLAPVEPDGVPVPSHIAAAFHAYFDRDFTCFEELALGRFGSPFERSVWALLRAIPPGTTRSYGEIARALGDPDKARAVGAANARNPLAIVVPCHRVIGADGDLTGYAAGLERKEWLLRHEGWAPRQGSLI